jgi:hypothetical protein
MLAEILAFFFFFVSVKRFLQTGSGAHPASYPMGTGGPFPGGKAGRGATLTTRPLLVPDRGIRVRTEKLQEHEVFTLYVAVMSLGLWEMSRREELHQLYHSKEVRN